LGLSRGEGKTDAKDAAIIADQVRMRRDLASYACWTTTSPSLLALSAPADCELSRLPTDRCQRHRDQLATEIAGAPPASHKLIFAYAADLGASRPVHRQAQSPRRGLTISQSPGPVVMGRADVDTVAGE
jgi:hypothetical protein